MQEYLFNKTDLEALIHQSPGKDTIAIRIAFEPSSGNGNEFKAIITASAVSSGLARQSDAQASNGRDLQTADVADHASQSQSPGLNNFTTFMASTTSAAATVRGCPNPPGCGSPIRQDTDHDI